MFLNFLAYDFIQRAYITGFFIAFLCASLGVFLVLRKLSLIGDGISHVSFGAIALGLFFGVYPLYVAIPVVIIASYLILKITQKTKINADASIGIVSSGGIAIGIILSSISQGFNIDLFSYLFGNILAISKNEMYLSIGLSIFLIAIIYTLYYDFFSISFDEEYAKVSGIKTEKINVLLVFLTAITVILTIKIVGVMLASALIILPASTSLQVAKSFKSAILLSQLFASLSVFFGITISLYLDIPAGATIVILNLLFFTFFSLKRKMFLT